MKKSLLLFLSLFLVVVGNLYAADFYWVGGGGSWSDLNHWRLGSSTGSTPSIVPSAQDNVFFTANSGFGTTVAERTINLDANGFCNSMTWVGVTNNPIINRTNNTNLIEVSGDLVLSPDVTYNVAITFKGATENTIKSNGTVLGYLAITVDKPNGKLSLLDSLVCTTTNRTNNLNLIAGTLDLAGKVVKMVQFNSVGSNVRVLDMTNATLAFNYRWCFLGDNKTLLAEGSSINESGYLLTDGGSYNVVYNNGKDNNNFSVNNTTFSKLTFVNENIGSYAQIGNGNLVDSLIFKGRGRIIANNKVDYIQFEQAGLILGQNNIIGVLKNLGELYIETGPQTVDSLFLAPNKSSKFAGLLTINKYFEATSMACEAFTELTGDTTSFQLVFADGANANINNVFLTGIRASGPITPLTVTGIDGEGNEGFVINSPATSAATTYYWVGGAGDWNDKTHWSLSSGGSGDGCIPFINDAVVFDGNSGFGAGNNTVTTTGNVYCHDMTWAAGVGTAIFNESSSKKCLVYGSVVLAPSITMNAKLEFSGNESSTIAVNGSSSGTLEFLVNKIDNGSVKLLDDWSNANATATINDGLMDMSGREVSVYAINSSATYTPRHIDISNANIHVTNAWRFTGLYKYLESVGSVITSDYIFSVTGLDYPEVNLTYGGTANPFNILSTNFGVLTFTSSNATSNANIRGGNTFRRLEFMGSGSLLLGENIIDSLILANSRNYGFAGINTINKYMKATSVPCTGLSELVGKTTGTLNFDPTAVIDISNVYLKNMTATGQTPVLTGADAGGNSGWTINSSVGSTHYWVGGSGDWNDAAHWSTVSGGAGGACIPTVYDDVVFDAGSGFALGNNTVTINNGNAYCHNLDWSGAINAPIWSKATAWNVEVWGETLKLNADATFNLSPLTIKGAGVTTLTGFAKGNFDIDIDKQDGTLLLANDYTNNQTTIFLTKGTLNTTGKKLVIDALDNNALDNVMAINMDGSIINTNFWRYSGDSVAHGLSALNSHIMTLVFKADGNTYDTVTISGTAAAHAVFSGANINNLTFTDINGGSTVGINGANNQIGTLTYKGGGAIYGTGNVIDTLIFFPGGSYKFTSGTNTTVNNAWYGSGTPCRLTEILGTTGGNATITRTNGSTAFDYVRVQNIAAVGISDFEAGQHSFDMGGNTGWDISANNGAAPLNGLGDDRAVAQVEFPYTIHTDGFFGTPLAEYTWGDGSRLDSLVITDTGYYNVVVRFEDGCTVTDTVHITLDIPLPIELSDYGVQMQNCTPVIHWMTGNQINFKHFELERSVDGHIFKTLAKIEPSITTNKYTYSDKSVTQNNTYYYRLKLVDMGDKLSGYSRIESAEVTCGISGIKIFPNPTNGVVNVLLPANFGDVKFNIYSVSGQKINADIRKSGTQYSISLHHVASGIYFIELDHNGNKQRFRVIKK